MRKSGEPRLTEWLGARIRMLVVFGLAGLGGACNERERLTFPSPGDGIGPVTMIDQPNGPDTTVAAGPDLFVNGRTIDPDGVDTVYFLVSGGQHFQPFRPSPPTDTVRFGVPITTTGNSGDTIVVQILGVDSDGNRGNTSSRRIFIE